MTKHYTIFSEIEANNSLTEKQIIKLTSIIAAINNDGQSSDLLAGYTYLGQLISHDIVKNTNQKASRNVTPYLNLDSIYGNKKYQQNTLKSNLEFKFSDPCCSGTNSQKQMDVFRINDVAQIPEQRNDENVLISQLHVFFQKLHNKIAIRALQPPYCDSNISNEKKFLATQEIVIKLFQTVVIEDYLFNIIDPDVYNYYVHENQCQTYFIKNKITEIPTEFSHAAFRFGHSMVRDKYSLNDENESPLDLADLFINKPGRRIHHYEIVDWNRFFGNHPKGTKTSAHKIDISMASGMKKITSCPTIKNIVSANLEAAVKGKVPTAAALIKHITTHHKCYSEKINISKENGYHGITIDQNFSDVLSAENTPLWLYILFESRQHQGGRRLGKLGSIIVSEVILSSIKSSPISILNQGHSKFDFRLNAFKECPKESVDSAKIYQHLLEGYRRLTMKDLINLEANIL